jgi:hypothetical protein
MTTILILLQTIIQSIAATLSWIGLYVGIRALPGTKSRRLAWSIGSAVALVITGGGGGGLVFPIVLIPTYAVPRSFLIHSYSLIGLLRKTSPQSALPDNRSEGGNVWNSRSLESARS